MPNLLADLGALLDALGIRHETGVLSGKAPEAYAVLTPIQDIYTMEGDGVPLDEEQEARISIFSKANYFAIKREIEAAAHAAGMRVTGRRYVGHEDDSGYHHYAMDVAQLYAME